MKFLKHFQILAKIQLFMNFGDYMLNIRIFKSYRVVYQKKKPNHKCERRLFENLSFKFMERSSPKPPEPDSTFDRL
jgi:hypothetical protein